MGDGITRRQYLKRLGVGLGLLAYTALDTNPIYSHTKEYKTKATKKYISDRKKFKNPQKSKNVNLIRAPNVTGESLEERIINHITYLKKTKKIAHDETVAYFFYDYTTNENLVSINADKQMQAASMIKPFVALAYFHTIANEEKIDTSILNHLGRMLRISDNVSTNFIMNKIEVDGMEGPATIQAIFQKYYGDIFQHTSISDYIPLTRKERERAKKEGLKVSEGVSYYNNLSSVSDYQRFLDALWHNRLPHSDKLKELMSETKWNRVLSRILGRPKKTVLYNKTGTTARVCGDISIVEARDKDDNLYPYSIIAIIEKDNRVNGLREYYAWVHKRSNIIRELSAIVHDFVKKRYNLP